MQFYLCYCQGWHSVFLISGGNLDIVKSQCFDPIGEKMH